MAKIPVRFKRVAAVFDEEARARLYESSGSEHNSAETLTDLSYLVNSFLENDHHGRVDDQENDHAADKVESSSERNCSDSEIKDSLKRLFDFQVDEVKRNILVGVENALRELGNNSIVDSSSVDFKRRLMARLRERGFDAGLCKSKWEKVGHCPSGDYEYIDVYASGTRYFIEVSLAKEFTIARPTECYAALLNIFPQIFVGKQDDLKQVNRLMCNAIKKSMKKMDIHVPPWRRSSYMQAKWFSSYKRTFNEASKILQQQQPFDHSDVEEEEKLRMRRKISIGFVPLPPISFPCREDFSTKLVGGFRVGNLAAALNDNSILS
ncbi:hypothetical protein ACH5RR_017538 [Cinchona calisaya]|uniref:DUF506 family protein n=1 Tax=Cinchona calisaya TaxID=153742 RepID=A0ABD2ZIU9_9GENT